VRRGRYLCRHVQLGTDGAQEYGRSWQVLGFPRRRNLESASDPEATKESTGCQPAKCRIRMLHLAGARGCWSDDYYPSSAFAISQVRHYGCCKVLEQALCPLSSKAMNDLCSMSIPSSTMLYSLSIIRTRKLPGPSYSTFSAQILHKQPDCAVCLLDHSLVLHHL